LVGFLIVISFAISNALWLKGLLWPSPGNNKVNGNPVIDFYRGIELYPRIGENLDLKTLINCRVSLFLLQIIYLAAWKANAELHKLDYTKLELNWTMTCVTALQTIYLAKWFYWEDGYKSTIDIIVDKQGFYLVNACLALLPSFYAIYSLYLVSASPLPWFGPLHALAVFALGMTFIVLTYVTDKQRQLARATDGKCMIWGKKCEVIRAEYKDSSKDVEVKKSLILVSGFWGIARHMNYLFEVGLFFAWGLPVITINWTMSIGTVIFVALVLSHRSRRDDLKCQLKYGTYWTEYCERVPYKMIPYVY